MDRRFKRETRFDAMTPTQTKFLISRRLELHDQFKDRKNRDKLWFLIAGQLKERFPDFHHSIRQVKKRYENVRLRYSKERDLVEQGHAPPNWEFWTCFQQYGHLSDLDTKARSPQVDFTTVDMDPVHEFSVLPDQIPEDAIPDNERQQRSQSLGAPSLSRSDRRKSTNYHTEDETMTDHISDLPLTCSVGFIGAGKMATAMAGGFVTAGLFSASNMCASCPADWDSKDIESLGVTVYEENLKVAERSDIIVIAVKPDVVAVVLKELAHVLVKSKPLILSVAAGITLETMDKACPGGRYIRVMPNTPALYPGFGATVFCPNSLCTPDDALLADKMLSCLGFCSQIQEKLIDAVTGLSGSGPAYVFTIIEALSDGGVKMGLTRDLSTRLAAQTVLGAANMVVASGMHPAVLRDSVASPGGTTIHGLHALEQGGLRSALINAVEAATNRAKEMGEESKKK